MKRAVGAVLALGLALGLAQGAPATEAAPKPSLVMQVFQDYCVKYGARQVDIMDAADKADFLPAPTNLTAAMVRSKATNSMARIKRIGGQTLVLMTFTADGREFGLDDPDQPALVDACIASLSAPTPGLAGELAAWLGPDIKGEEGSYGFIQGPNGPLPVGGEVDDNFIAAAKAGALRLAAVETSSKESSLTLGAIRLPAGQVQTASVPDAGPFNDFKTVCIDTKADLAAVGAAAQAWMPLPADDADMPYPMRTGEARVKSTEDDFELLFVGTGHMQIGQKLLDMTYCAVAQAPPNDTLLMKAAEDWIGVPPVEIDPGGSRIYIFTEKGGVHVTLGSSLEASLGKAMKAGPVWVAVLERSQATDGHSVAAFGRLTKVADF